MAKSAALFHKPKPKLGRYFALAFISTLLFIVFIFDVNWLRQSIVAKVNQGNDFHLDVGRIDFKLYQPHRLVLQQIRLRRDDLNSQIASIEVNFDAWALFSGDVAIDTLIIRSPKVDIDLNAPTPPSANTAVKEPAQLPINSLIIHQLLLSDFRLKDTSKLALFDQLTGQLRARNIEIIQHGKINPEPHLPGLTAQLLIDNLSIQGNQFGRLTLLTQTTQAAILVEQLRLENAPSFIDISAQISTPFDNSKLQVQGQNNKIQLQQFQPLMPASDITAEGLVEFNFDLNTRYQQREPIRAFTELTGTFQADWQSGRVKGVNLNSALTALKDSQQTSLLDIGGFVLTGPLGLIAGQLIDLSGGIATLGGETKVQHLSLHSQFDQGLVDVTNTALATDEYRVALKGKLDPLQQSFAQFQFAILDAQGCAQVSQTLNGPMNEPTSAVASNLFASIASPLTDVVSGVTNQIKGCDVFYQGAVKAPNAN